MQIEKRWLIAPPSPDAASLARHVGLHGVSAQLLLNRGINEPDSVRAFLRPELNHLHDPSLMPELDRAAERVRQAVERGEPIVIYGDYDVDGISAIAILIRCLALLDVQPRYYIPDRLEEGYGLNAAAVRKLAAEGARLLISVDCGINAVQEVALAGELGLDTIVTDHHEPGDELPVGVVLIDPKLPGCTYPFRELSGAGLAFKLAWAIGKRFSAGRRVSAEFREFLIDSISLAALGTIADVVPLRDENRTIAHFGLRGLSESAAPGIVALREASSVNAQPLSAFDIAFKLAPRLNAAGRLGSAREAVELLTTGSPDRAREIAAHLGLENSRRQKLQERILAEAREMIEADGGVEGKVSIVLARKGWHAGVIGIVASRLVEEYWRPTVLLTIEGEEAHGSARSVGPLDLFGALYECAHRLRRFGGHPRAAGLRLPASEVAPFKEEFERVVAERLSKEDLVPAVEIDAEVSLSEISRPLLDELNMFAPFGEGNAEPVLAGFNLSVRSGIRRMGSAGRHLSFWVNQDGCAFRAVGFGMGHLADTLERNRVCSLAFAPRINRWRGRESIELDIRDIKFGKGK